MVVGDLKLYWITGSGRLFLEEFAHWLSGVIPAYYVICREVNQMYVDLLYMDPMG